MILNRRVALCLLLTTSLKPAVGQQKVDPSQLYERIVCIVPVTGAGTLDDPKRPLFAPAKLDPESRSEIIAYAWQLADDGQKAIVQFVARSRKAFAEVERSGRHDVKVFAPGVVKRNDIQTELKQLKKAFSLEQIEVSVQ